MRWQSLLSRLLVRRCLAGPAAPSARPRLEVLEDRTLLNNRFVVPAGPSVDNVTYFSSLASALTRPGLVDGDTIQINQGSTPGSIVNANLPNVLDLTIRGDPNVPAANLPSFQVNDALTINANRIGFTLDNVNVVLQGGGLTFSADGYVYGSYIVSNFAGTAVTFNGVAASSLVDTRILAHNGQGGGEVVRVNTAQSSHNEIAGNIIVSDASVSHNLLFYNGSHTVSDVVRNNTFQGNSGASSLALLQVGPGVSGLTIRGNSFSDADSNQTAINVLSGGQNNTLADNSISLTGASGTIGLSLMAAATSTATSATVSNNRIRTAGKGTGMQLTANTGALNVRVEGNDFHFNAIGVLITRSHATDLASGIDLGGGSLGSRGGNNFRGFTATATATAGAIVEAASFSTAQTIKARSNLFSVADPARVVRDSGDIGGSAVIDTGDNLTGNAAFVRTLYLEYLHRSGDLNNPGDAGGWVNALNVGVSRIDVARGIMNSNEALGIVVDGLYRRYLNRDSDPTGRAAFIAFLQAGGTLEQATVQFLISPEYQSNFPSDSAYIQSLYAQLLGRTPGSSEVNAWVAALPKIGRAGAALAFLGSVEYRRLVVLQLYGTVLNRATAPSAAEVSGWVNSGLDLHALETNLTASAEFYANG